LYLALYFGLFGLFISTFNFKLSTLNFLVIPSAWVLLEYARSHLFTGFPWALLAYSQYLNLPAIQIADITGAWGVSFLVMLVNALIYSFTANRLPFTVFLKKYFVFILCIIVALIYGYYKTYNLQLTTYNSRTKISVIQGNIPQELKWEEDAQDDIVKKYLSISRQAIKDGPDLIIWPEASLPTILEEEPEFFEIARWFARKSKMPLLLGSATKRDSLYYNSALLVSEKGALLNRYDKLHLVPYGEYIPLRKFFPFLDVVVPIGDFASGEECTVFETQDKFSVLICFEDVFPELSRNFVKRGADFLVNITNDAWFGETSSPYQHLSASVFRAVENRRNLVRAANTGVSAFIAPSGEILSSVKDKRGKDIFIDGFKTQEIGISRNSSFYTRHGDFFIIACFLFALCGIIRPRKKS